MKNVHLIRAAQLATSSTNTLEYSPYLLFIPPSQHLRRLHCPSQMKLIGKRHQPIYYIVPRRGRANVETRYDGQRPDKVSCLGAGLGIEEFERVGDTGEGVFDECRAFE